MHYEFWGLMQYLEGLIDGRAYFWNFMVCGPCEHMMLMMMISQVVTDDSNNFNAIQMLQLNCVN